MEQFLSRLIEFLLGHIYFVIVIVGLIYTMFFRKSPLEKPPGQRPAGRPAGRPNDRMPDFGSGPMIPSKRKPQSAAPAKPTVVQSGPPRVERREPRPEFLPPAEPSMRAYEPEPAADLASAETLARHDISVQESDGLGRPAAVEAASRTVRSDEGRPPLNARDLTQAVIWAEILGPPRSKRPFRR